MSEKAETEKIFGSTGDMKSMSRNADSLPEGVKVEESPIGRGGL
jgi:hypothetical protein